MADHSLPLLTSTYSDFLTYLDARLDDLALGLSSSTTTATQLPTSSIRWNSTNRYWEINTGTPASPTWASLSTSYSININGTVGATTPSTGAFTTLSTSSVASLANNSTMNGSVIVNLADTQTLQNKTLTLPKITSGSFTYNFAVSGIAANRTTTLPLLTADDTYVFESHAQTLSNKTLTAPKFAYLGYIADANGNELVVFDLVASAVNEITVTNAATTTAPSIKASGGDANIDLIVYSKGTGVVKINGTAAGDQAVTTGGTLTLTNKTLTTPVLSATGAGTAAGQIGYSSGAITFGDGSATRTVATLDGQQTLSNKTLTAPRFADLGFIADANGNEHLIFDSVASAVNEVTLSNAATAGAPSLLATGGDANINFVIGPKGTGVLYHGSVATGNEIDYSDRTSNLKNKTLYLPKIRDSNDTHNYVFAVSDLTADRTVTLPLLTGNDTFVFEAHTQTLTNKTLGSGNASATWDGVTIPTNRGGTGTNVNPTQWGIIYAASTTSYASTAAGTANQVLISNGAAAPTWSSFDLSIHASDSSYKKIVRVATTANLEASTFATNVLTGYSNSVSTNCTTTAGSTTVTVGGSAGIKVGAVVSAATVQIAAGTSVASIASATSITVNNRAAITTTAITGTGATATATFAAQTYAPYAVGSTIVVSGATPATYNGSFVVTACTTTSVSWASVETVTATVQGTINFTIAAGTTISHTFAQTIAALSVDGITLALNDRVLVKDQTHFGGLQPTDVAKYNGIYYVSATGSTTVPWTLTRAADADANTDLDGAIVNVSVGTTNGSKTFKIDGFTGSSTLNTAPMYWHRVVDTSASSYLGSPTTAIGLDINIEAATRTLTGGNIADLAINALGQKTINSNTASTYTRASTLYIANAPAAGTLATFTNSYALYIAAGAAYLGGAVTTGSTVNGLTLSSTGISSAAATNLSITTGTTGVLTLDSGTTGAVNIGNNANAKIITIGNNTGATAVDIVTGTGNLDITTPLATISGDLTVTGGDIKTGAGVASTLFSDTTTGNIAIAGGLTTGTYTVGATGSTGAVSLFPATGSQAITLGGATTGTITIGSTSATAVQLPSGKTKIGNTTLTQGGSVTITLPTLAGTLYASGNTDVALADGGTNASLTAVAGGIVYSDAGAMAISAAGTSGQILASGGTGAPTWINQNSLTVGSVTNGVYTTGNQTIGGTKTFSSEVIGPTAGSTTAASFSATTTGGTFASMYTRYAPFKTSVNHTGSSYAPALSILYEYTGSYLGTYSIGQLATATSSPGAFAIHHINSGGTAANYWTFDGSTGGFTSPGSVTAYSDARLKKDLEIIPDALSKVKELTGYTYTRTDSGERQTGIIAQDLEKVLPEAVINGGEYKSVAYGNLVGLLIESIKELNSKVELLEKKLNENTI